MQKKHFFGFKFELFGCSHDGSRFTNEEQKMVGCDAWGTVATHPGLVSDVTDTDSWAQNGSIHGHVWMIFKR